MMKEIGKLDEQSLWSACFPGLFRYYQKNGLYTMRTAEEVTQELPDLLGDPTAEALARLELACITLWPQVEHLFVCDLFPHLLAAATDVLRAVDFGEHAPAAQAALIAELVDALNAAEAAVQAALQKAAEPAPTEEPEA